MAEFKRVVNVIPLTRVNLGSSQIFTYLVPLKFQDQIRPGQLVAIPFGRRKIQGITTTFEMHRLAGDVKAMKELASVEIPSPVMNEKALRLANWMAEYYLSSLGLVVKAMLPKFVKKSKDPEIVGYERSNPDFILSEHQRRAVSAIGNALDTSTTFLLHGVTGSGKTEVYMQVMERLVENGHQVMMLVPEISLTPQAVERLARRFGIERIALLHSRLSPAERLWMWQQVRENKKQVIVGPRSAVFAPAQDLKLIVIDEEHDPSYKQYDQNPRYHARTVAGKLSQLWGCPLVLGDATPSVESYQRAISGGSVLLNLPGRIKADMGMPMVKIVDMRRELESGNTSLFSEQLREAIVQSIRDKRQIILYLNRRGASTFVLCRDCGKTLVCDSCSSTLVWHTAGEKLLCHQCGKKKAMPRVCPACGSHRIKDFGIGTQKVEDELKKLRTGAAVERMDRDSTAEKDSAAKIYERWTKGEIDILIGTQMIGKAWDVPRVGLVGIISADSILHLPDFRSAERTFQTLTQVAGRAGRGRAPGAVILQTYQPENYAVQAVKMHDYEKFYNEEIQSRSRFGYPPFSKLVKITFMDPIKTNAQRLAHEQLRKFLAQRDFKAEILGPAPAFYERIRGKFRYLVVMKIEPDLPPETVYRFLKHLKGSADIDVDPVSLL